MMLDMLRAAHPAPRALACGPLQYYGGKGQLARRLLPFVDVGLPRYCEPYCGGASVFFAKTPVPHEVLNDLDGAVVNFFRQLREHGPALAEMLAATPYSRAEFVAALAVGRDASPLLSAWATFVKANQGFAGEAKTAGNWGRSMRVCSGVAMAMEVSHWRSRVLRLAAQAERLSRAYIECRDAVDCLTYWDTPATLHYVDPPYVAATRVKGSRGAYRHEMTDEDHRRLLACLVDLKGAVVLSGYRSPLYDEALAGWRRIDIPTACHAAGRTRTSKLRGKGAVLKHAARVESVWLSPNHPRANDECTTLFNIHKDEEK